MADVHFFHRHAEFCKALASEKRQMIINELRDGERSVSDLQHALGIAQANLSQHLSVLRAKGVLRTRREGPFVYYSLANPKMIEAFDLLSEVLREQSSQ